MPGLGRGAHVTIPALGSRSEGLLKIYDKIVSDQIWFHTRGLEAFVWSNCAECRSASNGPWSQIQFNLCLYVYMCRASTMITICSVPAFYGGLLKSWRLEACSIQLALLGGQSFAKLCLDAQKRIARSLIHERPSTYMPHASREYSSIHVNPFLSLKLVASPYHVYTSPYIHRLH